MGGGHFEGMGEEKEEEGETHRGSKESTRVREEKEG